MPKITKQQIATIVQEQLPFASLYRFEVDELGADFAIVRAPRNDKALRPGGTISGPVLMGLADFAVYVAIMSAIGPVELALTTSLNINFLRRPPEGDVVANARLIKLGKRLAVGEVELYGHGSEEMVAHVSATYSIPPQ